MILTRGADFMTFNDVDSATSARGIALAPANTEHGRWEYSADDVSYQDLGAVTVSMARLLPDSAYLRFIPNADFSGTIVEAIRFYAWDRTSGNDFDLVDITQRGGQTAFSFSSETASIEVLPSNDAPTIGGLPLDATITENETLGTLTFTIGDPDLPADQLVVTANSSNTTLLPQGGLTLSGSGATRTLSVTPAENQSGSADITVTVTDSEGASRSAVLMLTVQPPNSAPVAFGQTVGTTRDTPISFTLSGNDGNPSVTQTLTFAVLDAPDHGDIELDPATGEATYTPDPGYLGNDSFSFTARDDNSLQPVQLLSAPATVSITVAANNHAPQLQVLNPEGQPLGNPTTTEGTTLVFRALATDPDPADLLTYSITLYGPNGQAFSASNIHFNDGVFVWCPDEFQGSGVYTAMIRATDNGSPALADSETIQITVQEHNAQPLAYDFGTESVQINSPLDPPHEVRFLVHTKDYDAPLQGRTLEVVAGPGAIDPATNEYYWMVPASTPASIVDVTIRVTDMGSPPQSYDYVHRIFVHNPSTPPYNPLHINHDTFELTHDQTYSRGLSPV